MNLLPKAHEDFSKVEYWNEFYKNRGKQAFEWYGEYPELSEHLDKYVTATDNVLIVGCGNSTLSMDLYDAGVRNITSIDISTVAIKQMIAKNKTKRPDLIFEHMDATAMTYPDDKFSIVLDKGTLDALMPDSTPETNNRINKYFTEIRRVLKRRGRYLCVSLLQEHILKKATDYFPNNGFMFRISRCSFLEAKKRQNEGEAMPVFLIIATKFPGLPQTIMELDMTGEKPVRVENPSELISGVVAYQQASAMTNRLHTRNISDDGEILMHLCSPQTQTPRYSIYVLDKPGKKAGKTYTVFIVPQGRETEWYFGTPEGRQELLKTVDKDRVALVTLGRDAIFESMDQVKDELSQNIMNFAPAEMSPDAKIQYLSLGEDVGKREIKFQGKSDINGAYVVEDVGLEDGSTYRRLVFLNNPSTTQSEAKLKTVTTRRGKSKTIVDKSVLACEHHPYMSAGVSAAINPEVPSQVLVIGLGGGGLSSFLYEYFPKLKITAVDIDEAILKVATNWFDLIINDRMNVKIMDGLEYLRDAADQNWKYDCVIFDVDSKDRKIGISCPPKEFLEMEVLQQVAKCLTEKGLFLLNFVCRNKVLRPVVIDKLKGIFPTVMSMDVEDHLNEVFICSTMRWENEKFKSLFTKAADSLNRRVAAKKSKSDDKDEWMDVADFMKFLKIES